MRQEVLDVIYESIDQVNKSLIGNKIEKKLDSLIFGQGKIDSMAFVTFVISVEERVNSRFGVSVDLAGESTLMEDVNPFRSIKTLTCYIEKLLIEDE